MMPLAPRGITGRHSHVTLTRLPVLHSCPQIFEEKIDCSHSTLRILQGLAPGHVSRSVVPVKVLPLNAASILGLSPPLSRPSTFLPAGSFPETASGNGARIGNGDTIVAIIV